MWQGQIFREDTRLGLMLHPAHFSFIMEGVVFLTSPRLPLRLIPDEHFDPRQD